MLLIELAIWAHLLRKAFLCLAIYGGSLVAWCKIPYFICPNRDAIKKVELLYHEKTQWWVRKEILLCSLFLCLQDDIYVIVSLLTSRTTWASNVLKITTYNILKPRYGVSKASTDLNLGSSEELKIGVMSDIGTRTWSPVMMFIESEWRCGYPMQIELPLFKAIIAFCVLINLRALCNESSVHWARSLNLIFKICAKTGVW